MRRQARPADLRANFADAEPLHDGGGARTRAHRDLDHPGAIGEPLHVTGAGRPAGAHQEMTPGRRADRLEGRDKRGHAVEPIAEQETLGRHLREQRLREGPLRLARRPDGRRQRIVVAYFEQDRRGEFRKGGRAHGRARFPDARRDLRRIAHTELRAIDRDEPQRAPEGVGLVGGREGPEHARQQRREGRPREVRPPLGRRTVRPRRLKQHAHVLAHRAHAIQYLEDEGRDQLARRHPARAAAAPRRRLGQALGPHARVKPLEKVPRNHQRVCHAADVLKDALRYKSEISERH
ncbi:MAG: hypothetical protein QM736_23450 [Vicinamibacterales bacterium]